MMKKNDEFIGTVVSFGSNGEGIVKEDGFVVFLPFAIVGEKVRYKILKVTSKCAYGKVIEILEPSIDREKPSCQVFGKCGGCQLQHLNREAQLELKRTNIKNCFEKIAFIDAVVEKTECGEMAFGYRNKLQLPVEEVDGKTVIGFYAENSHRVVPISDCPINPKWTKDIIQAFGEYILEFNIKGYNNQTFSGELREITVKEISGNLIITAVVTDLKIRGVKRLIDILKKHISLEFSLYLNENKSRSNVIYGDRFSLVFGKGEYEGVLEKITYPVGVRSFTQVNNEVCAMLYREVINQTLVSDNTVVIDAYSGAGLMTAMLAKNALKAIGIEIIKEAVENANKLAVSNGLEDKITNYCGKCEDILPKIIEEEKGKGNRLAIVLDPPRKGCDIKVLTAVKNSGADRIVYVSCLPSSLARDVGILTGELEVVGNEIKRAKTPDRKYQVTLIKPFDMFPQTKHVETVVCLTRKE